MKALINHINFEFKSVIRDKSLFLMNYLFPLAFFFMMALIMPGINPLFSKSMIPSMVVFSIIVSALLGMPNPIVSSKEKGVYRSYKIYGVPLRSVLFVPAFTTAIHISIVAIIIYGFSIGIFAGVKPENLLYFCGIYLVTLFSFLGLGLLLGVCSPNSRVTVLLAQLVFLPSMMIGGVMMPIIMLPQPLQKIAKILPTSHAMDLFKGLTLNETPLYNTTASVIVLLTGGVLSFILSAYLFSWDSKTDNAKKNLLGIIAFLPYVVSMFLE